MSDEQQFNPQEQPAPEDQSIPTGDPAEGADYLPSSTPARSVSRGTLLMSLIVVAAAVAVWFMHKRSGPKAAVGAVATETAQAKKTINSFLDNGGANIKLMEAMLRNTEKIVQQFLKYPSMTQIPLSDLRTNPFRARSLKSEAANTDDKRDADKLAVRKSVESLRLQSVMYGEQRKACMINNMLYREGQQVESFTIEKITPTGVIVKNGSYRFELKMQR
ncbi:MAG: general secretion pathway protein GspB [Tepidisphaeraceae bacterium]